MLNADLGKREGRRKSGSKYKKIIFHFSVEAHTYLTLFVQMIYTEDDDDFFFRYLEHFLYVLHIFLLALSIRTFTCRMEVFDMFAEEWNEKQILSVKNSLNLKR
jgi:hypothetical protein